MARVSAPALLFLLALLLAPSSLSPSHAFTLFGSKDDSSGSASASQEENTAPAKDPQHQGGDGSAASLADLITGTFHTESGTGGDGAATGQQEGVTGVGVGGEAGQHHSWVDWAKEAAGLGSDTASK